MSVSASASGVGGAGGTTGSGGMGTGGMGTGGLGTGGLGAGGELGGAGPGGNGSGDIACGPNALQPGVIGVDDDGDGWTDLEGDCCDVVPNGAPFANAELVNPGAHEIPGDFIDNDCNPATPDDQPLPDCGGTPLDTPTSAVELVKAMDLCQFTVENPPSFNQKVWGVIGTHLRLADGTNVNPPDLQTGVLSQYGPYVLPRLGATMAALSTGWAREGDGSGPGAPQNGSMPGQVGGVVMGTVAAVPPAYLAGNAGVLPSQPGCGECAGPACNVAHDSVDLNVRIRVPTNAVGFHFDMRFFTSEFPEKVCQPLRDRFIATYLSAWTPDPFAFPIEFPIPPDGNVAFDGLGYPFHPVHYGPAFDVCFPPPGSPAGACLAGTLELWGTGMGGYPVAGQPNVSDGAATLWINNDVPAIPGETIEIDFVLWDAGDGGTDSTVLLDKWRWIDAPGPVAL